MLKFDKRLIWEGYIIFLSFVAVKKALFLLHPLSPHYLYFYFLIHFDIAFWLPFFLNFIEVLLNFVLTIALLGYVYKRPWGSPKSWRIFLFFKIIFSIVGNDIARHNLVSLYHMNPRVVFFTLLESILLYGPAFIAVFAYSQSKKIFDTK